LKGGKTLTTDPKTMPPRAPGAFAPPGGGFKTLTPPGPAILKDGRR
jgi:hypothetical protein